MEEILFWVYICGACEESFAFDGNPEIEDGSGYTICPRCGETSNETVMDSITRSTFEQLDRDTLIKVKEQINWLIERKTEEMNGKADPHPA